MLTDMPDPHECMHLIHIYSTFVSDHFADQMYFLSALKAIIASYSPTLEISSANIRVADEQLTANEGDGQQDLKSCDSICKLGH